MPSTQPIEHESYDVIIAGAGLAGLTLALQLKQQNPELGILIAERSTFPLAEATAKVGESTVEIGAHYLEQVLGLQDHLQNSQLPKFGLRLFFGQRSEFANNDEIGPSEPLPVNTYQIDRGVLENYLFEKINSLGIKAIDGCSIKNIKLESGKKASKDTALHEVQCGEQVFRSRWFIDACGRRGMLKKQLALTQSNMHQGAANWFRVNKTIRVDDWSSQSDWQARCKETRHGQRYLSTNHLMGHGYWIWIIPLRSGVTSFGIVFDPNIHSLDALDSFEKTLAWLRDQQPQCATALKGAEALDFRYLKDYSYDCKQVFSSDRWAMTGESGVFIDPLYSPGTDFIALGNGYITELIRRDFSGEDIRLHAQVYQKLYDSFYQSTLELFQGNYAGFGDYRLMVIKLAWDQAYYWGILGWLFFSEHYLDIRFMQKAAKNLAKVRAANSEMQLLFRQRGTENLSLCAEARYVDFYKIPHFRELNGLLLEMSDKKVHRDMNQLEENIELLTNFSHSLQTLLADESNSTFAEIQLNDDVSAKALA